MTVEIIAVGTEILLGNIVNTNSSFLAEQCAALGLCCYHQSVVGDNELRLEATLKTALNRADIVILTGGLGPTEDDLTKEVAAKVMGRKLHMDAHVKASISAYFERSGKKVAENNWKQAMVPNGSIVIANDNGTAPGILMTEGKKTVVLLPGPPAELRPMFMESIKPCLMRITGEILYSKTVKIAGISESDAEMRVKDLILKQKNPSIAPYAKTGEVHFRITAHGTDTEVVKKSVKPVLKEFKKRFGDTIYTTKEDVTLEQAFVKLLDRHHLSLAVAESCTGGLLAGRIVNVPGVSDVFRAGFVTYTEKAKHEVLGVSRKILDKYTAVSEETAREMAIGASLQADANVTIATTGLAGPDGGTQGKPVGLVYIACDVDGKITVQEYHFQGNRSKIREAAVAAALTQARNCVLEVYGDGKKKKNKRK